MPAKPFHLALPRYTPETPSLRATTEAAQIERLVLYREKKQIALTIRFDSYCDAETRHQLSEGIARAYGGCSVVITPVYPAEAFSMEALHELMDELAADTPACAHALSRCGVTEANGRITLIAEGDAEVFLSSLGCIDALKRKINERFGVCREVICTSAVDQTTAALSLIHI